MKFEVLLLFQRFSAVLALPMGYPTARLQKKVRLQELFLPNPQESLKEEAEEAGFHWPSTCMIHILGFTQGFSRVFGLG